MKLNINYTVKNNVLNIKIMITMIHIAKYIMKQMMSINALNANLLTN